MSVKQSSAGLLCRCTYCHGIFKLFSYRTESDAVSSTFECDCGRVIKIKETKIPPYKQVDESIIMLPFPKEVARR